MVEVAGIAFDPESRELLESLDAGYALPSSWYTDETLFRREQDVVLRRGWHYAAHTGELARAGDQVVLDIANVPLVLVRDDVDSVRGYINICRHHAHPVVNASGNRRALECRYDGWTYDLGGRLAHAPGIDSEPELDLAQLSLIPVQTAVWGPTVWANVDCSAPPFFEWIAGLPELVASHGVDVSRHVFALEGEWSIAANWKVFLDNAIECYHCPTCHPALSQVLEMDPALHQLSIGGRFWISHKVPLRRSAVGTVVAMPSAQEGDDPIYYHFHWIFPTTYFQYAGSGFDVGTIQVRGVDEILFKHMTFLPDDAGEGEIAERKRRFASDPTVSEDVAICERVQRAHSAEFAPPGRLLPGSEWMLQHFQRVIVELMAEPR